MPRVHEDVVRRLAEACLTGDVGAIEAALDPNVLAVCDGGGQVAAPIRPVHGAAQVARLLQILLLRGLLPEAGLTVETVNGRAALVVRRIAAVIAIVAVEGDEGDEERATILWVVLNPAKLRGWQCS
jgi:RNA polymerase sigma-70 factor (ECF subfamily)